jgi:hypothetical protein
MYSCNYIYRFFLIRKPQVPGIPAIPTCGVGYTLENGRCTSTKTIPTICPYIDGYSFEKNIAGACLRKCPSNTKQKDWTCAPLVGDEYIRVEVDAICPMYYTLKKAESVALDKCIDNNSKEPNYSCPDHHTLYKQTCSAVVYANYY